VKRNHLTKAIRSALMSVREPERAQAMKAYMKSEMPYLGVRYDPLRSALAPIFSRLEYSSAKDWRTDVSTIWHAADFREERYAAIELCSAATARQFQRCGDSLDLYEELLKLSKTPKASADLTPSTKDHSHWHGCVLRIGGTAR
jgi:3-methyladenine DNA glycosylase AlkD